jgi:hypothetical protein
MLSTDAMTLDNLKVGEKALTTRSALPLLTSFRDMFNWRLQTDWGFKGKNVYADFDMSVYTELQEDLKDVAEWVNKTPWLTPNEKREELGKPALAEPGYDEVWINQSMGQPKSEYDLNVVDAALNGQTDQAGGNAGVPKK